MASEEIRRIVIGLLGPQLLELRVSDDAYQALRKAVENGDSQRWHVIATQDSEVLLDLSKVVYVSLSSAQHRTGF
jgi:hypothetical protein